MSRAHTGRVSSAGRSPLRPNRAGGGFSHIWTLCVVLVAVLFSTAPASANLDYIFNQPAAGAPFGSVKLTTVSSTTVQVTVTLEETPDAGFVETGGHQTFDFTLAAPAITITNLTGGFTVPNGVNTAGTWVVTANSYTQSGFGTYDYSISCEPTCGSGASNPQDVVLTFDVNLASGISPTSFMKNASGFFFSADIFNGSTLPIGANELPEPMTLLVFGAGLAGAIGFGRWRKGSKPA